MVTPMEPLASNEPVSIDKACQLIDQQLFRDQNYPELWDLFHGRQLNNFKASFSRDYSIDSSAIFEKKKQLVLPEALFEQYESNELFNRRIGM